MRARQPRLVATFPTTHAALEAEKLCRERGIEGRIVPVPTSITADCGLAWSMPPSSVASFRAVVAEGLLDVDSVYELEL